MRIGALVEIENILKKRAANEMEVKDALLKASPKDAILFLTDECVLEDLMKYGISSGKICYDDNPYGFKNAPQVKKILGKLKRVWKGCVSITFSTGESHRICVTLRISEKN